MRIKPGPKGLGAPPSAGKDAEETITDAELLEGAQAWLSRIGHERTTFDAAMFEKCRVVSASMSPVPTVTFEMEVVPSLANGRDSFHGGAITTAFDNLTSCPLFLTSKQGIFQMAGVSRNLNVTFLRPAPVGSVVLIECSVLSMGKRLALTKGEMRRKSDGALIATCMHDKANTDSPVNSKL